MSGPLFRLRLARASAHALLLVAPLVGAGRAGDLLRAQAVACLLGMLALGEVEAAARETPDPRGASAPGRLLALTSAVGLLATAWTAIGFPTTTRPWTWLGAPLLLIGIALRSAAIRTLGASFTSEIVAAPGRALVTHGIYARLRHPSEAGLLLVALGLACLGGSAGAFALAALVVAPSSFLRIAREDRALAATHPAAHGAYRQRVRALG